jgi:hypothetical protein
MRKIFSFVLSLSMILGNITVNGSSVMQITAMAESALAFEMYVKTAQPEDIIFFLITALIAV